MAQLSPTMNVMIKAVEKATRSLIRDFGEVENLQVSQKGPGDFVSAADTRAEQIIHDELIYARPDYGFMMEEGGIVEGKDKDYRWIIDPLDGTSNFLHGLPHWSISIALEHKGEIIAGIVHDPVKDEMFHASRGIWRQGISSRKKQAVVFVIWTAIQRTLSLAVTSWRVMRSCTTQQSKSCVRLRPSA